MAGNTFLQKIKVQLDGANKASKGAGRVSASIKKMALSATAAGAAFFGTRMLIDGLKQSIQLSTKAEALSLPFEKLSTSIGGSSASIGLYRKALDGTVNDIEIMRMANQAMTLGVVDSEQGMAELFDTAQRLGKSLGVDTRQAVDSLVTGMGRQSILMLDNLGIIVDTKKANDDYAASLGISSSQLTEQQRKLAFNNATLESAAEKVSVLGSEQLGTSEAISQMNVGIEQMLIAIGERLAPVIIDMATFFGNAAISISNFFESFGESPLERQIRLSRDLGIKTLALDKTLEESNLKNLKRQLTSDKTLSQSKRQLRENIQGQIDNTTIANQLTLEGAKVSDINRRKINLTAKSYKGWQLEQAKSAVVTAQEVVPALKEQITILEQIEVSQQRIANIRALLRGVDEESLIQMKFANTELDKSNAHNIKKIEIAQEEFEEVNPLINIMKDSYNDFRISMDKAGRASIDGAMAIGASQSHAGQAAADAAGVYITAEIQKALSTMILKAFGEVGFFGGLGAVATAGAVGSVMAQTIKSVTAAEGFEGIVDEPTLFLAGEEGPEYVDVEPTMNEGAGRGGANITITGNVLSRDFIEDEAVPMIREALRKGGDIGIG